MSYIVFAVMFVVMLGAYYILTNLVLAIWVPTKVNQKWVEVLRQPYILWSQPIIKWVVPIWLALSLIYIISLAAKTLIGVA